MINECIKKKTKKNSALMTKLNLIDSNIKDRLIKSYLLRCRLVYGVRYLTWRASLLTHENELLEVYNILIYLFRNKRLW